MTLSINAEKAVDKIQNPFMINSQKNKKKYGELPQVTKSIYQIPTLYFIVKVSMLSPNTEKR